MELASDLGDILEDLETQKAARFRDEHRMPGWGFWRWCPNPKVQPFSEERTGSVRALVDKCQTCGATNAKLNRLTVIG